MVSWGSAENRFNGMVILFVWCVLGGILLGGVLQKHYGGPRGSWAMPDTVVLVDTIYAPPPGFSEAFNLECRWVPEEGR